METYNTQVMELLSLGELPNGCYHMNLGISHLDKQASFVIEIDEFTYIQLNALQPLNGGRVRLSPYPKWDPYRNTYYSALVRTTGTFRETLYFSCSEKFKAQMQEIQLRKVISVPNDDDGQKREAGIEGSEQRHARRVSNPGMLRRGLLLVTGALFAYLCIWFNSDWITNDTNTTKRHFGTMMATTSTDSQKKDLAHSNEPTIKVEDQEATVVKLANYDKKDTAPLIGDLPHNSAVIQKNYEVMEISEDRSFFALPEEYVALSFDDGPSVYTKKIVDILMEHKVAATFLFVGKNVERNSDAVIYASEHGMSIGNHSWDHSVLTKADAEEQVKNLAKTSSLIESITHNPVTLFRPPYGAVNGDLISSAKEQQLKVLLWNRDPEDWRAKKPEDIIEYFEKVKSSGGVFVLHEHKNTVEALPAIIELLKKTNLKFVTLE